ncbi:VanZ family protein [Bilifractor sp. HCP3S3_D3]|uniref:VanZ family protein n=1 Tax=Bilifractor sp. HCP3S3_D3 TaxID=3438907 RepID=UPI003F8B1DCE
MLRYIVFLTFIVVGFFLSRKRKLYPVVCIVYLIALFYYTFLSRMELTTTTEAVVATSTPVVQHWWVNAAYEIFRMKTSSYREACILNVMLFVPMGYLVRCKKPWMTILICSSLSLTIELLQELTGFGMFDLNDWGANTVGAGIGVILLWGCKRMTDI